MLQFINICIFDLERHIFAYSFFAKWAFTNYVDKTRQVGGTGNVNGMQIFPYKCKGNSFTNVKPGQTDYKKGQNLVNVVKECPLKRRPVIVKVKKCFELSYPGWQTYAKSFFSNVCLAQMGSRNGLVRISILNRLGYNYEQNLVTKVGFIYTFWYFLSSTS